MSPTAEIVYVKHRACGREIEARRRPAEEGVPGRMDLWCPRCERFVATEETDARGPVCCGGAES